MRLNTLASVRGQFYRSRITGYEYRYWPYRGYRIVYAVVGQDCIVVDFFHGARSVSSLKRSLRRYVPGV